MRFWAWAKRKKLSAEARGMALYLLTCAHGNSLGCFRLPMAYLCDDLDVTPKAAAKTLEELQELGFLERDEEGWTWLRDYLEHNPMPNGNVGKAVGKMLEQVPTSTSFYPDLLASLIDLDHFPPNLIDTLRERYLNGSDRVSRPAKTHTQTHEHDQTHNHTHEHEQERAVALARSTDLGKAVEFFNEAAERVGWPKVQSANTTRLKALTARLRDCGGIDGWQTALAKAEASDFLTGRTPPSEGHASWRMDFDFLLMPKRFTKLMEGGYDNRTDSPRANGSSTTASFAAAADLLRNRVYRGV